MRTLDLSPLFRSTVGFDRLDKLFDAAFRDAAREVSYPPYNIAKIGDTSTASRWRSRASASRTWTSRSTRTC
jgi:HSP20 family molecular chaperone IbpA